MGRGHNVSNFIPQRGHKNESSDACISAGRCICRLKPACQVDLRISAGMGSSLALGLTQSPAQYQRHHGALSKFLE